MIEIFHLHSRHSFVQLGLQSSPVDALSVAISVSVSVAVRWHISETTCPNVTKFCKHVIFVIMDFPSALRVPLCTSGWQMTSRLARQKQRK